MSDMAQYDRYIYHFILKSPQKHFINATELQTYHDIFTVYVDMDLTSAYSRWLLALSQKQIFDK